MLLTFDKVNQSVKQSMDQIQIKAKSLVSSLEFKMSQVYKQGNDSMKSAKASILQKELEAFVIKN